ncbi:FUSC family protein [Desulfosporosinus sp. SB140]|uniref:FUSC family protein n=1 Tax=Desulfosporosinus paludis TaxID=3115649 RepID=UPI00388DE889
MAKSSKELKYSILGARTLKTGVAVAIAMMVCRVWQIEPAVFAAITAVVNMQPSISKSLRNAWEQTAVHILGVGVAVILGLTFGTSPLVFGLAVILIIVICNHLHWSGVITLGVTSIVFILDAPKDQFLEHAVVRSIAVFIGLGVALALNRVLKPPAYKVKLRDELGRLFNDSSSYFLTSLVTFISSANLQEFHSEHPNVLVKKLDEVTRLYDRAREEITEEDTPLLWERLLEICRGFIERGQTIDEMTVQRVKRRRTLDSQLPPDWVSPEFRAILDVLMTGEEKLSARVKKVNRALYEKHGPEPIEDDIPYWTIFDQTMDAWQRKVSGVFYLRAMMEVAVVATEIRWAGRRLRSIYNISASEELRT